MIITQLAGGLGNQMFQYALGQTLALKNHDTLKLDIRNYTPDNTFRSYKLKHFAITAAIATPEEIARIKRDWPVISRFVRAFKIRILRQESVSFKPAILEKTGDQYLEGYWQSERYFQDSASVIRRDFTLKEPLGPGAATVAAQIAATAAPVSLHVRRGDYASDAKVNAMFGTCSPNYYRRALKLIRERVPTAHFFVFSDDIEWVKQQLELGPDAVFVSNKTTLQDYEELYLMSLCHHHIIANSSFSWWGAWLDPRPDKIVIAPRVWFHGTNPKMYRDIVPTSWIKL